MVELHKTPEHPVHTVVIHCNPDTEASTMVAVLRICEETRKRLNVKKNFAVRIVPAGPLRPQDFPEIDPDFAHYYLNPEHLELIGFLFLDCGGGRLDQHVSNDDVGRNSLASIDLMNQVVKPDEFGQRHRLIVDAIISENDRTGQEIVRDGGLKHSETPHTPRHLRNLNLGWNLLWTDKPEQVVEIMAVAVRGLYRMAADGEHMKLRRKKKQSEVDACRRLFLVKNLVEGVRRAYNDEMAMWFQGQCNASLHAMEKAWEQAEHDYWSQKCRNMLVKAIRQEHGARIESDVVVAFGVSDSVRFGPVCRRGNIGATPYERPRSDRPKRERADVVLQMQTNGTFVISSKKGLLLDGVAKAIRIAQMDRLGIENLSADERESCRKNGHFPVGLENSEGSFDCYELVYFAEFDTAVGDGFRANPHLTPTGFTLDEVVALVKQGLQDS